jgi:hypothetical protein
VWLGEKIEASLLPSTRDRSAKGAQFSRLSIVFWTNMWRVLLIADWRRRLRAARKGAAPGNCRERNVRDVMQRQGQVDTVNGRRLKMAAVQIMMDYRPALKQKLAGHALLRLTENDGKGIGIYEAGRPRSCGNSTSKKRFWACFRKWLRAKERIQFKVGSVRNADGCGSRHHRRRLELVGNWSHRVTFAIPLRRERAS